jgi:outer membrane protein OmpA-like peptidoglycan-associated protein
MQRQKKGVVAFLTICFLTSYGAVWSLSASASDETKGEKRKKEMEALQEQFTWWPTDAKPAPAKDPVRGGYWWWPTTPGKITPWGNRGYIYLYKIIYDYKAEELPPPKPQEPRPSLLIKKVIKQVRIYFDFDKADLREDATPLLKDAIGILNKRPEMSILVTGNCDTRGPESYNMQLGRRRAEAVKKFMVQNGISEERIRIVSRGKLDAIALPTDIVGMQKDRNAHFVIAEVEEVMIPQPGAEEIPGVKVLEEGKYVQEKEEKIETKVKVSTKEYTIRKGDTLWKIAQKEYGNGNHWKRIYLLNKQKIKNPNKLMPGQKILIPIE